MNERETRVAKKIYYAMRPKKTKLDRLGKLREAICCSQGQTVRFRVETKRWYGWGLEIDERKERIEIPVRKEVMIEVIDKLIEKEIEFINNFINAEVEARINDKQAMANGENAKYE